MQVLDKTTGKYVFVKMPSYQPTKRDIIEQAVAADNQHRHKGATGGLHRLEAVALSNRDTWSWDDSIPVIHQQTLNMPEFSVHSAKEFKAVIAKEYSWLDKIVTPSTPVAGGSVSHILGGTNGSYHFYDADIFLVGLSEEQCHHEIKRIGTALQAAWGGDLTVYRTQSCLTFRHGPFEQGGSISTEHPLVQVILRRYSTLSEVVHGFDFGSCAVAYDGSEVWFTDLAKVAFEQRVNVLDLTRRRPSYETRLSKYYQRGFGLVMPDLDVEKCKAKIQPKQYYNWVHMFRLELGVNSVKGMLVQVSQLNTRTGQKPVAAGKSEEKSATPLADGKAEAKSTSPAAFEDHHSEYGSIAYGNMETLASKNLMALQHAPVNTKALCGWRTYKNFATECDNTAIRTRFDGLDTTLARLVSPEKIELIKLERLVGKAAATAIVTLILMGKTINWKDLASRLVKEVETLASIPFKFEEVSATTFAMAPIAVAEYYGEYFKPAEKSAAAHT